MQHNKSYSRYGFPQKSSQKNLNTTNVSDQLKKFPIYPHFTEIISTIKKSTITIIQANTGSGKTIGIPNILSHEKDFGGYNYGLDKHTQNNIFCSVPTIAATVSAHKYQSELCHTKYYSSHGGDYSSRNFNTRYNHVGHERERFLLSENKVGFACEGNIQYDYKTKIVYCTTGHLLNKMMRTVSNIANGRRGRYNSWFCGILILDEFHIRTKESDICLCLWLLAHKLWKKNPTNPKPPKLIIMSATLEDSIINFFPDQPSILSYKVHCHDIDTVYDDESDRYPIDSDSRYIRAATLANQYHNKNYDGTYLIFVPGKQEIDIVVSELDKLMGSVADIIPAHGDLSMEELSRIHDAPDPGKRKIIVATNIAECSLTIENVSLVIDTLTHREANCGLDESLQLDIHWISKSNSKQRRGRTGRTCKGTYVIMSSEQMYLTLPENITPELSRISISYDILKLMKFNLDPKIVLAPVLSEWQVDVHINLLKKLGFIVEHESESSGSTCSFRMSSPRHSENKIEPYSSKFSYQMRVTDMGDFCSEFPLGIRKSAMLYHLREMDDPNIFLHLAVICTLTCYGSGIFYWPRKNPGEDLMSYSMRKDDAIQMFEDKFAGYSDIDTIFNIWITICSAINPFYITNLRKFCKDNQLNFRRFKEIVMFLKQCVFIGNKQHISLNAKLKTDISDISDINRSDLSKTFYYLLGLTHLDYVTTIKISNRGTIVAECGGLPHSINNHSINKMNVGNNPHQIYYSLIRTQRTTKKGIMRIINVMHTIPMVDDDTFSIFSSDVESGSEQEQRMVPFDKQILDFNKQPDINKNNWNKFLSLMEINMVGINSEDIFDIKSADVSNDSSDSQAPIDLLD